MDESLYHQFYNIEQRHWWFVARQDILLTYIRSVTKLPTGSRILDVGCGTGAMLEALGHHFHASGIDSSPIAIDYCRKRGLRSVFCGGFDALPAGLEFDLLTFFDVIEHLDDDRGVLKESARLLTTNGSILVTVPAYQWMWSKHDELNHHKRRYTASRLASVVHDAGFSVIRYSYFNTILFPFALLRRWWTNLVDGHVDELALPPPTLNTLLQEVFRTEKFLVPRFSLPFGLSILCYARKAGSKA